MAYYLTFVRMTLMKKKKSINRDFPGGPVVKTPCFQNAGDMGFHILPSAWPNKYTLKVNK